MSITDKKQTPYPHGLSVRWPFENQLCILRITNSSQAAVDEWVEVLSATFANWPEGQLVLIMLDFREQGLTPYLRQKAMEAVKTLNPDKPERIAIVLSRDILGVSLKLFVHMLLPLINNENSQFKIFHDELTALRWLSLHLLDPEA
jgi:hypothetical protein